MSSLITANQTSLLWGVLFTIVAIGFWSESTALGRRLSGVIIVLGLSMLLSNIGVLPTAASVYDSAWSTIVPVAIPLLLAKANIRTIFSQTGHMLIAFVVASVATVSGVLIAFLFIDLGNVSSQIAGIFAATYIGGSVNFAAVVEALEVTDSSLLSATVAADNVVGSLYLVMLALIPSTMLIQHYFVCKTTDQVSEGPQSATPSPISLNPAHIAAALALGCIVSFSGKAIAQWLSLNSYSLMITTALAFLLANLFPRYLAKLQGEDVIGMLLMYVFFAAVGAGANIGAIFNYGLSIFAFAAVVVICHFLVVMLSAYIFRLNIYEALIASNACIMGPATAAAQAASQGCKSLVSPAIICGSLGYAFANFIALAITDWLS